jgi:hypothetical protein
MTAAVLIDFFYLERPILAKIARLAVAELPGRRGAHIDLDDIGIGRQSEASAEIRLAALSIHIGTIVKCDRARIGALRAVEAD